MTGLSLGLGLGLSAPSKGVGVDARYGVDIFAARSIGVARFRNGLKTSTSLTDVATVTRLTTSWGVDQAGVLSSFAPGQPVVNTAGLAVYEARTNLLARSQEFQTAWAPTRATITADATTAPDGTTTADKIVESDTGSHYVLQGTSSQDTSQDLTISAFFKAGEKTSCILELSVGVLLTINLLTGVGTPSTYSNGSVTSYSVTALSNGWYRAVLTGKELTGGGIKTVSSVLGTPSSTGDGTSGLYLWGVQLEARAFASPYIPTTSAAATRNADVITEAVNIPVGQAFTVTGKFQVPASFAAYPHICTLYDAGASNKLQVHISGFSSTITLVGSSNGVSLTTFSNGAVLTPGAICGFALAVAGTSLSLSVNGATVTTSTMPGGVLAALATLSLGMNNISSQQLNSTIRDLQIVMRAYSSAELQAASDVSLLWDEDFTTQTYRYVGAPYASITDLPLTTFTRATTGYGVTAAGTLTSFASGAPRVTDAGLTVEAAATNLLLRSQEFDSASWSKTDVAVTANATTAPDGTLTADKVEAAGGGGPQLRQSVVVSATAVTLTVYAKQGTGPTVANAFGVRNDTTNTILVAGTLNYSTGTWTYNTGASGVVVSPLADGWWRVQMTVTAGITSGDTIRSRIGFDSGSQSVGVFGYFWGAQLETSSFAASYIPTTSSSATRNADVLASTDTVISPTIVAEFTVPTSGPTTGYPRVFSWNDGTNNNNVEIYLDRVNLNLYAGVRAGGADQAFLFLGAVTLGSSHKVAMRVATNDFAASRNGAAVVTDTSVTLPAPTVFRVGDDYTLTRAWGAGIRRIRRFSVAKTNAELQALST